MKTKDVYVAWTNTDRSAGRGWEVPLVVCDLESTAIRLGKKGSVQGCDCRVTEEKLIEHEGKWYGPVHVVSWTTEDLKVQETIDRRTAAVKKGKDLGLSDEDIAALSK